MDKTTKYILVGVVALVVVFIIIFGMISSNNQKEDNEWSNRCKSELSKMGYSNVTDFSCDSTAFGDNAMCTGSFRQDGKAYSYYLSFIKVGGDWLKDGGYVDRINTQSDHVTSICSTAELPESNIQFGIAMPEYVLTG